MDYIEINRQSWNNRVEAHLKSEFYGLDGFLKRKTSLNDIELELPGGIEGKNILHLQCHFGQGGISPEGSAPMFQELICPTKRLRKATMTKRRLLYLSPTALESV